MAVKRKILVVDDAPMFRELGAMFLGRSGRVLTACDWVEALEIANRERPDVIVTDMAMPVMDGGSLCEAIRRSAELKRTPIIALTGRDDGVEHERAVRAGADDILEKPLNRLTLIQAVNHYLRLAIRGLARVPLETDVHLAVDQREGWGRARNISRGGIFLELEEPRLDLDTELSLEFDLPAPTAVHLCPTAKVVWRRPVETGEPPGVGLRFLKLDPDAARVLDEYVYEHALPETPEEATAIA